MAGKSKKKESKPKSKEEPEASGADKKKKKSGGGGGRGKKGKSKGRGRCREELLAPAALDNCYHACHNVQDLLQGRGFVWPEAQKKKKKGKR